MEPEGSLLHSQLPATCPSPSNVSIAKQTNMDINSEIRTPIPHEFT